MIEELDRLRVERKVVRMLVIEKVDRVLVEAKGERLEKGNVVGHHLLVGKIKLMNDDRVDVVVGQQVVNGRLVANILKENVERLEQLDADIVVAGLLVHDLEEVGEHISLKEEVEHGAVVLVAPDENLGDGAKRLHEQALVAVRDHLVLGDDGVEVLQVVQRVRVLRLPYAPKEASVSEHFF